MPQAALSTTKRLSLVCECDGQTSGKHPLFLSLQQSSEVVEQADCGAGWTDSVNPSSADCFAHSKTSGKLFNLSAPPFPYLQNGDNTIPICRLHSWSTNVSHFIIYNRPIKMFCIPKNCSSWDTTMSQLTPTYVPCGRTARPSWNSSMYSSLLLPHGAEGNSHCHTQPPLNSKFHSAIKSYSVLFWLRIIHVKQAMIPWNLD